MGFSGGKDSTMLASLIFDVILSIPAEQRKKEVSVVCTDTRVEIPAIAEMIEGTLDRMHKFSRQNGLNVNAYLPSPMYEESFWVNIIGRGSYTVRSGEGSSSGGRLATDVRLSG